jgi:hypothetical protein
MKIYSDKFYRNLQETSMNSARIVVPLLMELLTPESVIDVGCGTGIWLHEFMNQGVIDILGIDGQFDQQLLCIPSEKYRVHNLQQPLVVDRKFDVALSLEVAEHLPPNQAENFVESLTRLAPVVVFSAAIPHQGGYKHLNEQWQQYWVDLFEKRGYTPTDYLRKRLWHNREVAVWYIQNTLIYTKQTHLEITPKLKPLYNCGDRQIFSVVHPTLYSSVTKPGQVPVRHLLRLFPSSVKRTLKIILSRNRL